MKIFEKLYDIALRWARHRYAPYYLGGLSFAESSFFPVPPDVMLAPMVLSSRNRAWFYASITTLASVAGGAAGYVIGLFAFELIAPLLHSAGYWQQFQQAREGFEEWGVWIIFIAGFSPIPYKIFTISAGAVSLSFIPFLIASFIGRGARFFLVAGLIYLGGEKMEKNLRRYVDALGWLVVVALVIFILVYKVY
ncbi:MAG: DedA family protein, partial [Gammaproteobacteria bacterium]|nr:DedA family protein [Gammaproteobacteria bacterium]